MTPARERKSKERQAKRDAGLVRVEVWVPHDKALEVKELVSRFTKTPAPLPKVTTTT